MKRVLIIVGTRPEVIKLAPVIAELKRRQTTIEPIVCATGQHRGMLDQMMSFFGMTADIDLDLMRDGQTPTEVASKAIAAIGEVVAARQPSWVVVQGDTTTAMAASIAAFYGRAKVAHVEAGLRTADPFRPFPEEINRRIIGRTASLHFAPTARALAALRAEGVDPQSVIMVGNTVIDALFATRARIQAGEIPAPSVLSGVADKSKLILMTLHRRENFGDGVAAICGAVGRFVETHSDWTVILPVHPNPAVRDPVRIALGGASSARLIDPLAYDAFVSALDAATLVVTDSGGVQEEAAALGKPIIVLRSETERPEAVDNGNAVLVGSNPDALLGELELLARDPDARARRSHPCLAFGDGAAAQRIADALEQRE